MTVHCHISARSQNLVNSLPTKLCNQNHLQSLKHCFLDNMYAREFEVFYDNECVVWIIYVLLTYSHTLIIFVELDSVLLLIDDDDDDDDLKWNISYDFTSSLNKLSWKLTGVRAWVRACRVERGELCCQSISVMYVCIHVYTMWSLLIAGLVLGHWSRHLPFDLQPSHCLFISETGDLLWWVNYLGI